MDQAANLPVADFSVVLPSIPNVPFPDTAQVSATKLQPPIPNLRTIFEANPVSRSE